MRYKKTESVILTASELMSILQEIFILSGKDFRAYAYSSIKRRIEQIILKENCESANKFLIRLRKESLFIEKILPDIYVEDTEIFRDAETWNAIQRTVIPILRRKQNFKIAVPNCISSEELISLIILLDKANILSKANIHASFLLQANIDFAKQAKFPIKKLNQVKRNLELLKNKLQINDIFEIEDKFFYLKKIFYKNIEYTTKNFFKNEKAVGYDLILFRNKLIYFNNFLYVQTVEHILEKLNKGGFLIIGIKESLGINIKRKLKIVNKNENIYKK